MHAASIVPSLSELAATANREHDLAIEALTSVLSHAIASGDALLEAQRIVGYGQWAEWLAENFSAHHRTANTYMLFATYREQITGSEAVTIRDARLMLRAAGMTRNPSVLFAAEARRLYRAGGVTYRELGDRFGVSGSAVQEWVKSDLRQKRIADRQRRRRAEEVLKRSERDAAARRFGGGISEAYSQIRKLSQILDALGRDGADLEIRKAANSALRNVHRAEDSIVRTLGLS